MKAKEKNPKKEALNDLLYASSNPVFLIIPFGMSLFFFLRYRKNISPLKLRENLLMNYFEHCYKERKKSIRLEAQAE